MERVRTMQLRCELLDHEVADRAIQLATLTGQLTNAEDAKARAAKEHGARCAEIRERLNTVSQIVRERAEFRDVEVYDLADFEHGCMETFRRDTGSRVFVRPLTDEERQMRLVEEQRREALEGDADEDRLRAARADRERERDEEAAHDTGDVPDEDEAFDGGAEA